MSVSVSNVGFVSVDLPRWQQLQHRCVQCFSVFLIHQKITPTSFIAAENAKSLTVKVVFSVESIWSVCGLSGFSKDVTTFVWLIVKASSVRCLIVTFVGMVASFHRDRSIHIERACRGQPLLACTRY